MELPVREGPRLESVFDFLQVFRLIKVRSEEFSKQLSQYIGGELRLEPTYRETRKPFFCWQESCSIYTSTINSTEARLLGTGCSGFHPNTGCLQGRGFGGHWSNGLEADENNSLQGSDQASSESH
jgi:hypothetical protein